MKNYMTAPFLILEAVLYLIFTGMDLCSYSGTTIAFKYAGILLCLLFSILCACSGGDPFVPAAQLFTASADFFLLVINEYYLAGILLFIGAQTVYLIRLYRRAGKIWLPARIACALLAVLILCIVKMYSLLNLAAVLYFSLLLINMAVSWTLKTGMWREFSIGLSLFVLCDICVGLFNLGKSMPAGLYHFSEIGMWLFYLPSQVLISLSSRPSFRAPAKKEG